jgi:hypothetical protein
MNFVERHPKSLLKGGLLAGVIIHLDADGCLTMSAKAALEGLPKNQSQLSQGHRRPESLFAQISNAIANNTTVGRSAFYPTFTEHVAQDSFACRRQSLMRRPLGLHEFLQNVPLPHVGMGTAHFGFIHYQRTKIPPQRTIGLYQQRRQRHFSRPRTVLPSRTIKTHLHRIWNARRRAV